MINKNGYVVITIILIVSSILVLIGVSLAISTITEGKLSLAGKKTIDSSIQIESCIDETLLYLSRYNDLPTQVSINGNVCTINVELQIDDVWTFVITTDLNNYNNGIRIVAERSDSVYILDWEEVK